MNILLYADSHGSCFVCPEVTPEAVFILGDLHPDEIKKIDRSYSCLMFGVKGAYDKDDAFGGTSNEDIHEKVFTFNGYSIAGFGGTPPFRGGVNGQYSEDHLQAFLNSLDEVDIFVSHSGPTYFEHFEESRHSNRGFRSFNEYMQPAFFLHGNIHNSEY